MRIYFEDKDINKGNLILVNADHAYRGLWEAAQLLGLSYMQEAEPVLLKEPAACSLLMLLRRIGGMEQIVPVSGWRSMEEQQQIWADSLRENGQEFTQTYVAVPGHSEHQTGLAIDLGKKQDVIDFIRPDFPYDGLCQIFRENAAEYGFIERYPKGRESITGIGHEPWHFRFVGTPHAAMIKEHGFTLEEYISYLRGFPYGQEPLHYEGHGRAADIIYLKSADTESGQAQFDLEAGTQYSVSGNNVDGFIVTIWKCA
ncbi:MAG: M15 family metallopeptidase [Eubacterium sp.]|jgi:D-alanyl-D-alanine dipeptidase/carboxypeptidase|nr:M15 family metallopeptidase [Eubacterium sp.]MCI8919180.1 M15 family metallopeptidase [Eubacterium sp.]